MCDCERSVQHGDYHNRHNRRGYDLDNRGHGFRHGERERSCEREPRCWRSVNEGKSHRFGHRHRELPGAPANKLGRDLGWNYLRRDGQAWFPKKLDFGAYGDTTY